MLEQFQTQIAKTISDQTAEILIALISHNQMDTSCITEEGVWYVGSAAQPVRANEIETYLNTHAIHEPADIPQVVFAVADQLGDAYISVTGKLEYHSVSDEDTLIKVSYNADWILVLGEWKMRKLITSSRRDFDNPNVWNADTRIDNAVICDSMPVGLVCCSNDELLTIQLMNEHAFGLLGFSSASEYKRSMGESVLAAIHPDDLPIFRRFILSIQKDGFAESEYFRMRKKDYTYLWTQFVGGLAEHKWVMFALIDYSQQKKRSASLEEKHKEALNKTDFYRDMVDSMPGGFHKCSLFEPIQMHYISDSLCEMSGYSKDEIFEELDGIYTHLVFEEDHPVIIGAIERLMEYPHTEQIEYRLKRKDGSLLWVSEATRSARDYDGKLWAYAVVQDINDIRMHQALPGDVEAETPLDLRARLPVVDYKEEANKSEEAGCRVRIQTFGYFDVFVDDKPINFHTKKGRELLALLVDRRGGFVSQNMIISTLWEDETANPTTLGRCRRVYKALVDELKEYGIDDILESDHGARRVVPEKIQCDLYDYLTGKPQYESLFKGNYMMEYSWSEVTLSELMMEWESL